MNAVIELCFPTTVSHRRKRQQLHSHSPYWFGHHDHADNTAAGAINTEVIHAGGLLRVV